MKQYFFLLGADDPEMQMNAALLHKHGQPFSYATTGGERSNPRNAYAADPIEVPAGRRLVLIECEPRIVPADFVRIDHHRPGDPGYAKGPADYWPASSIGQLHILLGIPPTEHARIMAAYDHCFAAAMRGECDGVVAGAVLAKKMVLLVQRTKTSWTEIRLHIEYYQRMIAESPVIEIGPQEVRDMRHTDLGAGYSFDLLITQVAAATIGASVILRHSSHDNRSEQWTITGNTLPPTVEYWMEVWAPQQGLVDIYGVPARGYAGGYME